MWLSPWHVPLHRSGGRCLLTGGPSSSPFLQLNTQTKLVEGLAKTGGLSKLCWRLPNCHSEWLGNGLHNIQGKAKTVLKACPDDCRKALHNSQGMLHALGWFAAAPEDLDPTPPVFLWSHCVFFGRACGLRSCEHIRVEMLCG